MEQLKKAKRGLTVLLCIFLMFALAACGVDKDTNAEPDTKERTSNAEKSDEVSEKETDASTKKTSDPNGSTSQTTEEQTEPSALSSGSDDTPSTDEEDVSGIILPNIDI